MKKPTEILIAVLFFLISSSATRAFAESQSAINPSARKILSDRGVDKLVFIKRLTFHSSHFYTDFIDGCDRFGGNLCVLDLKSGKVTDLVPEMKGGIFGRFCLHFDADKLMFSMPDRSTAKPSWPRNWASPELRSGRPFWILRGEGF